MYIFGYLRASTQEQDAHRAQKRMKEFVESKGQRVAGWYVENVSGASLQRPELLRLLEDANQGDAILIEQVDRLSRLSEENWQLLKALISEKRLSIISLDLPTSHMALSEHTADDFTDAMLKAVNSMLLDMLAAIARKDYQDRRRRQAEGILKAKESGKYKGRPANDDKHQLVRTLRKSGHSIADTARLAGVSVSTVTRISKSKII
ncbi:recombinase family protein [Nissabacter sp. SGAir0207]|uniref:recombinase family protein n=1 Tax=Nissabacter sp. SGAir0207 TaxID=2126321 RepID=UPI0010CCD807|nr:recombinase family protein [Nissabacter sp. SGAir0207]QCR38889.1 serine recombinase [Nissabacter sp. SGAir0207]